MWIASGMAMMGDTTYRHIYDTTATGTPSDAGDRANICSPALLHEEAAGRFMAEVLLEDRGASEQAEQHADMEEDMPR